MDEFIPRMSVFLWKQRLMKKIILASDKDALAECVKLHAGSEQNVNEIFYVLFCTRSRHLLAASDWSTAARVCERY
jgi:hypothetical protein